MRLSKDMLQNSEESAEGSSADSLRRSSAAMQRTIMSPKPAKAMQGQRQEHDSLQVTCFAEYQLLLFVEFV